MILELLAASAIAPAAAAVDLLPDEIIWTKYMYNVYVGVTKDTEPPEGRKALRFPTYTANKGDGPLELRGGAVNGNLQEVNQRIYRSDGSWYDRLAGYFTYHDVHDHIHFVDWTQFRLREYLPGGGVGPVIREGTKTSFCVVETTVYDNTLEGHLNPDWGPYGCNQQIQGQRPGWADGYDSGLPGQYIDIEGVPDGTYWLEGEVDPLNNVVEKDETNNVDRVMVSIGDPPPAVPDRYEQNDSKAQVDFRQEGGLNSPNLGLINALKVIPELSMDDTQDWFKFRLHGVGGRGDYIQIESPYQYGQNLWIYLYNSTGGLVRLDRNTTPIKQMSLENIGPGTFYLKIVPDTGANPNYLLKIEPDGNLPPELTLTSPPAGTMLLEQAVEQVPVRWLSMDPEGDPKTVSIFIDREPIADDSNIPVGGYQDLPGGDLMANVNTATMALGPWYIIGRASDGGAFGYAISPGLFKLYMKGDINYDGRVTLYDYLRVFKFFYLTGRLPAEWSVICDMDRDGDFDAHDLEDMRNLL